MIEYKGHYIEKDLLGHDFYTVFFEGDDVVFPSVSAAKHFIDVISEIPAENE